MAVEEDMRHSDGVADQCEMKRLVPAVKHVPRFAVVLDSVGPVCRHWIEWKYRA